MRDAKQRKMNAVTADEQKAVYQNLSKHDIRNALTEPNLPLSDLGQGPFRMMPPELLHVSGSGLIMYMFVSLKEIMGSGRAGNTNIIELDARHQQISDDINH